MEFWRPEKEWRYLAELEKQNRTALLEMAKELERLEVEAGALEELGLVGEEELRELQPRLALVKDRRSRLIEDARTLATRQQTLLLRSTSRATWVAAAAAAAATIASLVGAYWTHVSTTRLNETRPPPPGIERGADGRAPPAAATGPDGREVPNAADRTKRKAAP